MKWEEVFGLSEDPVRPESRPAGARGECDSDAGWGCLLRVQRIPPRSCRFRVSKRKRSIVITGREKMGKNIASDSSAEEKKGEFP